MQRYSRDNIKVPKAIDKIRIQYETLKSWNLFNSMTYRFQDA